MKVSESRTLAREGSERERGEERVCSTVKEGRVPKRRRRASKEISSWGGRRKHERMSGCKSPPGGSTESWFHSKSGQA